MGLWRLRRAVKTGNKPRVMADDSTPKPPPRAFSRPSQVSEAPPRGRMPSWALGTVLSLIVLAAWAIFLQVAPNPSTAPSTAPPQEPAVAEAPVPAADDLRLLLWRNVIPAEILAGFEAETGLKVA